MVKCRRGTEAKVGGKVHKFAKSVHIAKYESILQLDRM